ncbi:MAG: hypothetical protein ACREA7_08670 [Nitrosotalea sp.]
MTLTLLTKGDTIPATLQLRVRQIRQTSQDDEIGPAAWFLTTDSTLSRAEIEYFEDDQITSSVTADTWFQIMSNLISPSGNIKEVSIAFTKLLSSHFNSHKRNLEDYLNFVDILTEDADYTLNQLKKIVGNEYITQKLIIRKKKIEAGEKPTDNELKSIIADIQKVAKDEFNKKVEELKSSQNKQFEELKATQNKKVEELTSSHKKQLEEMNNKFEMITKKTKKEKKKIILLSAIILSILVSIVLDLSLFKESFANDPSKYLAPVGMNLALIFGVPVLIEMFYKSE